MLNWLRPLDLGPTPQCLHLTLLNQLHVIILKPYLLCVKKNADAGKNFCFVVGFFIKQKNRTFEMSEVGNINWRPEMPV